jgi:signal transduction histidine kinase/CheY-like chemotaxis protein/HPt (histidine-containing phosphotransfer) domain-containing protein
MSGLDETTRVLYLTLDLGRGVARRVLRHAPTVTTIETLRFAEAPEHLATKGTFDVVLLDATGATPERTEEVLALVERRSPSAPIVVLTDDEDVTAACRLVGMGAADVLHAHHLESRALGRSLALAVARRRSRDAARAERDEAMRASRAKSEFLANVSHEIRAPLNTVLGMADLLAEATLPDRATEQLAALRRAGDHILALADDILDLARIESGFLAMQKRPFDLVRVAESALELFIPAAREKKLDLRMECGPDLPRLVEGDARRLRQILVNLLGNAVKFTESGAVSLTVARHPGRPDEVQLGVHDTGIGIPGDRVDGIFASFVQGDDTIAQRFGGAGLGLHIVKQLVTAMDGAIEVKSEVGRGSDFEVTLRLPAADLSAPSEVPKPLARTAPTSGIMRIGTRQVRVLLVDDSMESRSLVGEYLRGSDLALDVATDGAQALAQLGVARYDVVLMDLHLPGMDGFATTIALRKMERERGLRPVPVVALSADALAETVKRALAAGCAEHLSKPITKAALLDALRSHVTAPTSAPPVEKSAKVSKELPTPAGMSPQAVALFPQFLDNRVKDVVRAREALARGDKEAIARLGHNMRGNGVSYGLPRISTIGALIEDSAKSDDDEGLRGHIDTLESYIASVRGAVGKKRVRNRE